MKVKTYKFCLTACPRIGGTLLLAAGWSSFALLILAATAFAQPSTNIVVGYSAIAAGQSAPWIMEGIQAVVDDAAEVNPKAKNYKAADFVDLSLLHELDKEGFIKKVWAN